MQVSAGLYSYTGSVMVAGITKFPEFGRQTIF
jgi:hypothetical protein